MQSITVDSYHPFPAIHFTLPSTTPLSLLSYILSPLCPPALQSISTHSNQHIPLHSTLPLSTLSTTTTNDQHVHLRLAVKLLGGKGGFASQLRAQGGRMSSNKATNNDSCRDLNGRRLSTINEATKLAAYLQAAPNRAAAETKKAQERLDALNLEIARLDGATSSKRRLDDNQFVEESREIVEGVKDAVREAMLKKRRKNKEKAAGAESATAAATASSTSAKVEAAPVASSSKTPVVEEQIEEEPAVEEAVVEEEPAVEEEEEVVVSKPVATKGKGKGRAKK